MLKYADKKRSDPPQQSKQKLRFPEVSTPINISKLQNFLAEHPDKNFVSYLIDGLKHGFHTGFKVLPTKPLECKNLLSARSQPQVTSKLIQDEVNKGFLAGPYAIMPFEIFRVNPIGVAEGKYSKKKRLIVDLSAPHNDPKNVSLNDLIDKSEFSLQYVTIDQAIKLVKRNGKGSWLCKTDISDAFKLLPIHPSLWPFHAIKWDNQYYFYTRLVFGSRSSPKIFDHLSQAICWIASNIFNIPNILHLLDDFLTVDAPDTLADKTMALLSLIFNSLDIPIAPHKTIGPTNCLEYLGIMLDTKKMEARLPKEKVVRICEILHTFKHKKSCSKRELLSLLGHLNFASRVIRPGRSFVAYLINLSTTVKELHHHVKLSQDVRLELDMWLKFLSGWNGVSFFLDDDITTNADMHLFTDATDKSFGGIYHNQWFQGEFPAELLKENDTMSMALFELYPIVVACVLWGKQWKKLRIVFHCDNMSTVQIINKGRSKGKTIMKLMRKLTWCSATFNFTIHAQHVPGSLNSVADAISRFQMDRFCRLAPSADHRPTSHPPIQELLMF